MRFEILWALYVSIAAVTAVGVHLRVGGRPRPRVFGPEERLVLGAFCGVVGALWPLFTPGLLVLLSRRVLAADLRGRWHLPARTTRVSA